MPRWSATKNHVFNMDILSLNHFKFHELLEAKCDVEGQRIVFFNLFTNVAAFHEHDA